MLFGCDVQRVINQYLHNFANQMHTICNSILVNPRRRTRSGPFPLALLPPYFLPPPLSSSLLRSFPSCLSNSIFVCQSRRISWSDQVEIADNSSAIISHQIICANQARPLVAAAASASADAFGIIPRGCKRKRSGLSCQLADMCRRF